MYEFLTKKQVKKIDDNVILITDKNFIECCHCERSEIIS